MIKYIFLLLPLFGISQVKIPNKTNEIIVSGVTFKEVANGLLDAGFSIEKVDSNFNTIKTEFIEGSGKTKYLKLRLMIRVKDSTAIITGEWYNPLVIGSKLLGTELTIENSTYKIEYTSGSPKQCFLEMNKYANYFKKPITYSKK
jgi:hypothetical protein